MKRLVLFALGMLPIVALMAQSTATQKNFNSWTVADQNAVQLKGEQLIVPKKFGLFQFERTQLLSFLEEVPMELGPVAMAPQWQMEIPMPDGSTSTFVVAESPIMAPELAAKFPEVITFRGQGVDDPNATIRLDLTPAGFHAMIRSPKGSVFVDPYSRDQTDYCISYYKNDLQADPSDYFMEGPIEEFEDESSTDEHTQQAVGTNNGADAQPSGSQLRTYRLAVAATGEYTQFHGGTVAGAISAIITSMNRVNGIYENEAAIRMVLIGNNDQIIYTNGSTDPYTNGSASAMIGENQSNITSVIGSANFDIGHVFGVGGGGLASVQSPCKNNSKARGVSAINNPIGDAFDVDYICHEIGHQFGARHTFNGSAGACVSNITNSSAYEPGSGSTIMGYTGICAPQNLQNFADDYFHTNSFDQMVNYSTNMQGNNCPVITNTGNSAPVVDAGTGGYFIPMQTPFELTGSATDPNGDPMTYCWEQFDLGPQGHPNLPVGNAPLFRTFDPETDPTRLFPRLVDVLTNSQSLGEILPATSRPLNFRLTARDNRSGGGGVDYDLISFNVTDQAGPFSVTKPNTGNEEWTAGGTATVEWDVSNTDLTPVNCQTVNILLSINSGFTFPFVLATGVPNNGTAQVSVPDTLSSTARIRVEAADHIFLDISDKSFSIVQPETDIQLSNLVPNTSTQWQDSLTSFSVLVSNLGGSDESNFTISYEVDNAFTVTDIFNGTLVVGDTATHNFSTPWKANESSLAEVCAFSSVVGDGNLTNDTTCLSFNSIVGLDEPIVTEQLVRSVYPVPANDQLHFVLEDAGVTTEIELYDVFGRIVLQQKMETIANVKQRLTLNTASVAQGIYLYRLSTANTTSTGKVTISR